MFTTGNKKIDQFLGGGLKRGETTVLVAPSAGTKSAHLLNWADCAHMLSGAKVLYISQDMDLLTCAARHASLRTGMPYQEAKALMSNGATVLPPLEQRAGSWFRNYEATTTIVAEIVYALVTPERPDLLIWDYLTCLTAHNRQYNSEQDNLETLQNIAKTYNMAVLTAVQAQRHVTGDTVDAGQVGVTSDHIIYLDYQREQEKINYRFVHPPSDLVATATANLSQMQIIPD